LSLQDGAAGGVVSNMKLQKLLYYTQGIYVAVNGADDPLFADRIFAWDHGPVITTVYQEYCRYRKRALPLEDRPTLSKYDSSIVEEVYRVFSTFSGWQLRVMTHAEAPWKEHYRPHELNIEIPRADLETHFKQYIKT
jgi:uncharacterized phage-associated protein